MKKLTRRTALKNLVAAPATALGFAAAIIATHKLGGDNASSSVPDTAPIPVSTDPSPTGLIRPPGAVEEEAFLAGCIRCYRCQDACDVGAIRFFTEADGKHYHTPYIDPAFKGCTLCMRCTQICPTHVLHPMKAKERDKAEMGSVELREDRCLSYKAKAIRNEQANLMEMGRSATESEALAERRGPCGECHMFCPLRERAIKLEPGAFLAPIIYEKECVGCGMCEEICRTILHGDPAIRVKPIRWKT